MGGVQRVVHSPPEGDREKRRRIGRRERREGREGRGRRERGREGRGRRERKKERKE